MLTSPDPVRVPGDRWADGLAGDSVLQAHGAVATAGGDQLAVGAKSHTHDRTGRFDDLERVGPLDHRREQHAGIG